MNFKFRIPYDDREKIEPIFQKFGQHPFTRAKVVATEGMPLITSGDVVRWEGHGMIERLGREKPPADSRRQSTLLPYMWRISDRTVHALTKKPRPPKQQASQVAA